ncbi:MAG TPA: hypothetical protein VJN94_00170 [Candidatus Binataceae bacterium]|nr:hypothetical protein [Candidatus Binataceae bacterium]
MVLRAVILWVHVLCGVAWVGACASFVIAAAALGGEPGESRALALRAAPRINRLCIVLAIAIPLTGIGNLTFAAQSHGYRLPTEFVGILTAKIGLFIVMALALAGAWRVTAQLTRRREANSVKKTENPANIPKLTALYGLIVAMGTLALALGLWLSGT